MTKSIFLYGVFLAIFTIFTYLFVDSNLIYFKTFYSGFALDERGIVSLIYILLIFIFFTFYYFLYNRTTIKNLKKLILVSIIFLFFSYPAVLSYDIFNYITTAKVFFHYLENPYIIYPIEFIGEPYLEFTRAANKTALYGPFWITLSGIPLILGFGNFILTLFNFKLLSISFYLGISYLIYKFSKDPKKVAFFALNPLVLIETAVSGHNDVAMMFFALSSFYLLKKNKYIFSLIILFLSILIKFATIFLIPVFIYYLYIKLKKKSINWDKIFMFSSILMLIIFFLSPLREEIYPWYGIWFLTFVALIRKYKFLRKFAILLSFVLLLRYIPFMYLGTYFGPTPFIKITLTFVPIMILLFYHIYVNRKTLIRFLQR